MINIATVDQTIAQQGQFCLLDWLLAQNLLAYSDYEAWRHGQLPYLDQVLAAPREDIQKLLEQTQQSCNKLKLAHDAQEYFRWDGDHRKPLLISADSEWHKALGQRWLPPQDVPQMDLFMDNSATIAENQVLALLAERRFEQAQQALQQLAQLNPAHAKLGGYQDLVNYGLHIASGEGITQEALLPELLGLDQEVTPLAKELLRAQQRDYLAFAWRRIAEGLMATPVDLSTLIRQPKFHVSFALQQIPDWQGIVTALTQDPLLLQSPELLARLAEAYAHCCQIGHYYWLWGIALERFSDQVETLMAECGGLIVQDWDDFLAFDEHWPAECFLGFLLIQQPGLVHVYEHLPQVERSLIQLPVNRAVFELVKIRLAEGNEKQARENLKKLSPELFGCYLNKRNWARSRRF